MSSKKIINVVKLPTLSKTLIDILEAEKSDSISFLDDIKRIVEKDPLLSAHILQVANSPIYGFSQKIRTISHAIGLLGIHKIKVMAFSFSIFEFFKKVDYKRQYGLIFNLILKKSLLISTISITLAKRINCPDTEELYATGLLAEIGELIFFLHSPEKYSEIYSIQDKNIIKHEKELFKCNHIELGYEFCHHFNFPTFFLTTIKNHAHLTDEDINSRVSFISTKIAELLLEDNREEKSKIFKKIENDAKKLLHLSLPKIEEIIKGLPTYIELFTMDFPELQEDLTQVAKEGFTTILDLIKKETGLFMIPEKLSDSQKKLASEKIFLSHMLNLSYFFSSLMPPLKIISSLFEYFEIYIPEFSIEFITPTQFSADDHYLRISNKNQIENEAPSIDIKQFDSFMNAKISNEMKQLDHQEMLKLNKNQDVLSIIFPISYNQNFFGFLIFDGNSKEIIDFDIKKTYLQILINIIANSFQNYLSFDELKNETNKKELITKELFKFDHVLNQSKETLIDLQKSQIMGELLPTIFHKLKNKLTPILGYAQILLTKIQEPSTKERLKKIEKNANDLAHQLNVLRDYFKTEKIPKERENLNTIIYHMKQYLNEIETNENIIIELDLEDNIPANLLNLGQIEVLLKNLIDNSVLAIKKKGNNKKIDDDQDADARIIVKTQSVEEGNKLLIKDNGIGIKDEHLMRIWAPFYSDFPHRAGIGLSICEKIISNHFAIYQLRSEEGKYTEFEIIFKETDMKENQKSQILEAPSVKKIHSGRILIIDDEAYLLDLMKEILLNEGDFDIITTSSGREAIDLINRMGYFDLVISDIFMPEIDGMDIYNELQNKQPETRVLMVTADPFRPDIAIFLKKNKIKFLRKPFELMKFKNKVIEELTKR